jgi:hypothetical protein
MPKWKINIIMHMQVVLCTEKEKEIADEFWPMNECPRMIHPFHVVLFTLLGNMSCPE